MVLYLPDNRRRLKRHWKVLMGIALLLGMAGVALGLKKALDARRGRQMIQWGDTAMAAGKYESAAVDYTRARGHYPNDIDLADKAGDALYQASAARPPALFEARSAWQQALSINPDHLPTLHRLLNLYAELVEITPTQSAFGDLGQIADTVAGFRPMMCRLEHCRPSPRSALGRPGMQKVMTRRRHQTANRISSSWRLCWIRIPAMAARYTTK